MSNIELFYDHCAEIFDSLYRHFPATVTFASGQDPNDMSDDQLRWRRQKIGALEWLARNDYIDGVKGMNWLDDATLSEKGMRFLRLYIPLNSEPTLADFRRAAEAIFS